MFAYLTHPSHGSLCVRVHMLHILMVFHEYVTLRIMMVGMYVYANLTNQVGM